MDFDTVHLVYLYMNISLTSGNWDLMIHVIKCDWNFTSGKLSKEEWHRVLNSSGVPTTRSGSNKQTNRQIRQNYIGYFILFSMKCSAQILQGQIFIGICCPYFSHIMSRLNSFSPILTSAQYLIQPYIIESQNREIIFHLSTLSSDQNSKSVTKP